MTTLNDIADNVHQNAVDHGFHPPEQSLHAFIANQVCNIHAEVTEFWDGWRSGTNNLPCDKAEKMGKMGLKPLTSQEEELADIIIRCLDVSRRLGIDIEGAIEAKHFYNTTRPFKHGKLN